METIRKAFDGSCLPSKEVNEKIIFGGARGRVQQTTSASAEQAEPVELVESVKQPDPVCKPVHVWTYRGNEAGYSGFGISEDGIIGQVTGNLRE